MSRRTLPSALFSSTVVSTVALAVAAVPLASGANAAPDGQHDDGGVAWSSGGNSGWSPGDGKDPKDPKDPKGPKDPKDPKDPDEAEESGSYEGEVVSTLADTSKKPTAQPLTPFEMPFPCGEVWTGTTRASHSPSVRSVDFNRADDLGDPVVAAAAGVVTTAVTGRKRKSYGQFVVVDHGNDESTLYAHLDTVTVTVGQ